MMPVEGEVWVSGGWGGGDGDSVGMGKEALEGSEIESGDLLLSGRKMEVVGTGNFVFDGRGLGVLDKLLDDPPEIVLLRDMWQIGDAVSEPVLSSLVRHGGGLGDRDAWDVPLE